MIHPYSALKAVEQLEVVGEAANGHQGLQTILEKTPDIAIIALTLPDIDGIEVTQRLKKDPQTASTRILILTNKTKEKDVLAAFVAGADSYLLKDIEFTKLIEVIETTYEGNSWIDPSIADIVLQQITKPIASTVAVGSSSPNNDDTSLSQHSNCMSSEPQELFEMPPLTNRELDVLELIVVWL